MRRTPNTTTSAAYLVALFLLAGCAPSAPAAPTPSQVASEIEAVLHASAEAWTRGDLDGFLDDYAEDATFVGSSGLTRGREQIRAAYVDGYWSTGMPEDGLRFRILDTRPVGAGAAVVVGRYELFDRDTGETSASGVFSLTWERRPDGWRIVHDHSSADPDG